MANLLWLQGGACSRNAISFLDAEQPSVCDLVTDFGIAVLWHPSLGLELGDSLRNLLWSLAGGHTALDILVFEGTGIQAPDGSGAWNRFAGRPMEDWITDLAKVAGSVIAIGDRASGDGASATEKSLGADYRSRAGLPVINVPGHRAHPDWITQVVVAVATGRAAEISLDDLQRPRTFSSSFTQTWRARNMRFAHEASATELGQRKGWLYYELGSRGPMTHSPCNRILWNRQSKTRAGMPHPGGTDPGSPFHDLAPVTVLTTHTVRGVPREVPSGIDKPGLIRLATAATASSPSWAEEDIFVV